MAKSVDSRSEYAIGVFDSGVGGLTVLNALRQALPEEHLVYLGDTAKGAVRYKKVPCRSGVMPSRLSVALSSRQIKAIVVACNTASAMALEHLQACYPDLLVLGVIEPGC